MNGEAAEVDSAVLEGCITDSEVTSIVSYRRKECLGCVVFLVHRGSWGYQNSWQGRGNIRRHLWPFGSHEVAKAHSCGREPNRTCFRICEPQDASPMVVGLRLVAFRSAKVARRGIGFPPVEARMKCQAATLCHATFAERKATSWQQDI